MPSTPEPKPSKQEYLFGAVDDRERLVIQHKCFQPSFIHTFQRVLDEYGLGPRLQEAAITGKKLQILEVGCSEGLFLYDVAAILEAQGLLAGAEFYGLDRNAAAITTADTFRRFSKPPRPYLNFYIHDLTQPLEDCVGLRIDLGETATKPYQFDFIYASMVFEHIANAQQQIQKLFDRLRPGGVLYLRDAVMAESSEGWLAPHEAMQPFFHFGAVHILAINAGLEVAQAAVGWLKANTKAEKVQAETIVLPMGGDSELGLQVLRGMLLIVQNIGPSMVKLGQLSEEEYRQALNKLLKELGPHTLGQWTLVDTLARRI